MMALIDNINLYYKLDEASGTTVNDASTNNDGTNSNATVNVSGKINTAYSFNGSSSILTSDSNTGITGSSARTISAWVYLTDATADNYIVSMGTGGGGLGGIFKVQTVMKIDRFGSSFSANTPLSNNTWHHVAYTFDGATSGKFYLDGSPDGTFSGALSHIDSPLQIGATSLGFGYTAGKIDEVGAWDRVLSDSEISDVNNSDNGLSYPFDASTTAESKSIELNNGTIISAILTATYTGDDPTLSMTADGTNFETVTSGVRHFFTNTGGDLKWKATGESTTITNIKIEVFR